LSSDPTYTVPSAPTAGEERTTSPVAYFHLRLPSALSAYRLEVEAEPGVVVKTEEAE
jgi:hypothetical protein